MFPKHRKLSSTDYRDVIRELKKEQLVGDAILPFYEDRLKQIEDVITEKQLVTLLSRPAKIRIATAASFHLSAILSAGDFRV